MVSHPASRYHATEMSLKVAARWLLAVAFLIAGLNHFRDPAFYLALIPPMFPAPEALNIISGAAEIAGAIGVLYPPTRRYAGWGLIALLIAVFPANIYPAIQGGIPGTDVPAWALWVRLPFQAVFIAWVWWTTIK
jgi:uncharacterized membrane protein